MLRSICIYFVLFTLLLPNLAAAQNKWESSHKEYISRHWGVEEGLPLNAVNHIIQSENGFLWMATLDGLARFDGYKFDVYKGTNVPVLPSNRFINVRTALDQTIWAKTEQNHLIKYDHRSFEVITDDSLFAKCYKIFKDDRKQLWFATDEGIFKYDANGFSEVLGDTIQHDVDNIFVDIHGRIWFNHSNKELYCYDGEIRDIYLDSDVLPINDIPHVTDGTTQYFAWGRRIIRSSKNDFSVINQQKHEISQITGLVFEEDTLLYSTALEGIFKVKSLDNNRVKLINETGQGIYNNPFHKSSDNALWYTDRHSVYRNGKEVFKTSKIIKQVFSDDEENIWLATKDGGIYRLKESKFKTVNEEDGLSEKNIYPILEAEDGSVYVGTYGSGIDKITSNGITNIRLDEGVRGIYVLTLEELPDGSILAGTLANGLYLLKENGEARNILPNLHQNYDPLDVYSVFLDSQNRVWVGTREGLFFTEIGEWDSFKKRHLPVKDYVRSIAEAPDGTFWMGTNGGGLLHLSRDSIEVYSEKDGMSSNLIRGLHTSQLTNDNGYIDSSYEVWVATENKGLARIIPRREKTEIFSIRKKDGLFEDAIHTIVPDSYGRLWISSNNGLFWVPKSQLINFTEGKSSRIYSVSYNQSDGLLNSEFNGGVHSTAARMATGELAFASQAGLVLVKPSNIKQDSHFPDAQIKQISFKLRPIRDLTGTDYIELNPDHRSLELEYTAFNYRDPENVDFFYKLQNYDEEWIEAGKRRIAQYTNLPAGQYTFKVKARNKQGKWSPEAASVELKILPYFYETLYFKIGLALFVLGLIYGIHRLRLKVSESYNKKLESLVQERTEDLIKEKNRTQKQVEKIKTLEKNKSLFYSGLSHELRTPLTLVMGPLNDVLHGKHGHVPKPIELKLESVKQNTDRLLEIINLQFDKAKIDEGLMELELRRVNLPKLIRETISIFESRSRELDQHLTINLPDEPVKIYVDQYKIQQVISNLISNAIKFTPVDGHISVNVACKHPRIEITVEDDGYGISKDDLENIFDPYFQANREAEYLSGGFGLGLAYTRQLVELHEGSITADSELENGSTFVVTLYSDERLLEKAHENGWPIDYQTEYIPEKESLNGSAEIHSKSAEDGVVEESLSENAKSPKQEEKSRKPENSQEFILVVDDDPAIRLYVDQVLNTRYQIAKASHGKEAIEIMSNKLPDLVIADIMMPEMDGYELIDRMKQDPYLKNVPVVFLSGKSSDLSRNEGLKKGAVTYLTKPFSSDVLISQVASILTSLKQKNGSQTQIDEKEADHIAHLMPSYQDPFMEQVYTLMERNIQNPDFSIEQLAVELYLDRSQLYRKIKQITGITPSSLMHEYRMLYARRMLKDKNKSISDISFEAGFSSLSYFSRSFRKRFEKSPRDYQQEMA